MVNQLQTFKKIIVWSTLYSTYHIFKVIGSNIPEIKIFTGGWRNGPPLSTRSDDDDATKKRPKTCSSH